MLGFDSLKSAVQEVLQPENVLQIDLSAQDFNLDGGFCIFVPNGVSGDISAVTLGGQTIVISNYEVDSFLRSGARFKTVNKIGTTALGLEAWY